MARRGWTCDDSVLYDLVLLSIPSDKPEFEPLFPKGLHPVTTDEVRSRCVDAFPLSTTRTIIFKNLLEVLLKLTQNGIGGDLWIDGSFVTTKINPRDVDVLLCISSDLYDNCSAEQRTVLDWIESDTLRADYRCDGYISIEWPAPHPLRDEGLRTRDYWRNFFGTSRDGHDKGIAILRLTILSL